MIILFKLSEDELRCLRALDDEKQGFSKRVFKNNPDYPIYRSMIEDTVTAYPVGVPGNVTGYDFYLNRFGHMALKQNPIF